MNTPNKLTLLRMALIPLFVACFYMPLYAAHGIAAVIFSLAYATDILDGQLARKHNIVTDFGKLMDPIADKLLSSSAFIMLVAAGRMDPIPAIIIIGREFLISGFRLVAAGKGNVIAASWLGKIKTTSQYVAVVLLLIWPYIGQWAHLPAQIVLWVSVGFTIWSGWEYIAKNKGTIHLQ